MGRSGMLQHATNNEKPRYIVEKVSRGEWRIVEARNNRPYGSMWFSSRRSAQTTADMLNGKAP